MVCVALYTARICEFFERFVLWFFGERSFSIFRIFSDSFWSNSPTVCLFLSHVFSKACVSSHSWRMRTTNNSLSTMSSPVPVSSRSSSGSTPAPTVATPASPPSQPVSLPENNALAQAISRALAESLPPLLSALRDSSGGNTNMATTAGPLSSASTSSPPPASSSSGTLGPTSQSSGTLVVPSFISTYSSHVSPSVVSSFPATSSAILPLVVGGSCGGTTGTEFSTFPNLSKAFVVGPGYAPIPYKLVSRITAGLFVDLADLLPDNIRAQEIEPQVFLEGKLVVSGSKKRVVEIADIITWIEAFTIFSMILCHTFPSRWKDLNQYKLLIIQTARRFPDKSWLHYDIAFRKEAAASGSTDWSRMHPDLYNFHTRSPVTASAASGSSTSSALSLTATPVVSHALALWWLPVSSPGPLQFSHQIPGHRFSCFRLLNFLCLVTNSASGVFRQAPV